jgi:alcohol dehydrogenase (NADP+)
MIPVKGYAVKDAQSSLTPFSFERRDLRPNDVHIDILYCGVCHSDIHQVRNEWGGSIYPMVPGHEIVGRVKAVGEKVSRFKPGDLAAVGVMIETCNKCKPCNQGLEQYCAEGFTDTYNAMERDGKTIAMGGYSTEIVSDEKFTYNVPASLDLKAVAPLLCAGITTYSPLRYANVGKGTKTGVIGLGGLGHMAVKFAVSFGAEVTVLSTSPAKEADARRLGAHHFALTTDKETMKKLDSSFDVIIDTASADHDFNPYLDLLGLNGKLMVVGLPSEHPRARAHKLTKNRRSITGSCIGSLGETQEMLDYCAKHNIVADVEVIPIQKINEAYERMIKNDVKYRFVIDLASLK